MQSLLDSDPEMPATLRAQLAGQIALPRAAGPPDYTRADTAPDALRERLESPGHLRWSRVARARMLLR